MRPHPLMIAIEKFRIALMEQGYEPDFALQVSPDVWIGLLEEGSDFTYNMLPLPEDSNTIQVVGIKVTKKRQ